MSMSEANVVFKVAGTLRVPLLFLCAKRGHTECACYFHGVQLVHLAGGSHAGASLRCLFSQQFGE
jgi:hypothetical protein